MDRPLDPLVAFPGTDYYLALAYIVRDRLLQRWISTAEAYTREGSWTIAY